MAPPRAVKLAGTWMFCAGAVLTGVGNAAILAGLLFGPRLLRQPWHATVVVMLALLFLVLQGAIYLSCAFHFSRRPSERRETIGYATTATYVCVIAGFLAFGLWPSNFPTVGQFLFFLLPLTGIQGVTLWLLDRADKALHAAADDDQGFPVQPVQRIDSDRSK